MQSEQKNIWSESELKAFFERGEGTSLKYAQSMADFRVSLVLMDGLQNNGAVKEKTKMYEGYI